MMIKLGRITPVDVRSIWMNEASHFTPWLAEAENLSLLGETLHLGELTLQTTERGVGDFSADIVAVDESGGEVLIENQLEPTDHRHLGQVLTYLAGLGSDAATVVWITTRFREEHRAAVDWLNRQTGDGFDFFGVEIEVIQISDSAPAPRFNVVAMPNDWAKQARQAVRRATVEAPSEVGSLYQDFWLGLRQAFEQAGGAGRFPKAWPRHWLPFAIGRSGFQLSAGLFRTERQVRFELYMHQNDMAPKQAYRALEAGRSEIEAAYGGPLDWQELPESRASRIAAYLKDADVTDRADWPRQQGWVLGQLVVFRQVFAGRIRALDLGGAALPGEEDANNLTDIERSGSL